ATDLHLNHFFLTESIRLPVTITNVSADTAKGNASLSVYLSTTNDFTGSVTGGKPIKTQTVALNLAALGTKDFNLDVALPTSLASKLTAGEKFYFIVKLSSTAIKESDNNNGDDPNNVAASANSLEYLGKPSKTNVFSGGTYFGIVRDTLN